MSLVKTLEELEEKLNGGLLMDHLEYRKRI